ncbi:short-chain dehydrogenase/reductase [Piscinibacter koreensis]|uniref:SDR family NAD(P)-dependent oxidoreductase n=1 Tax=Piscinibacter koreensis TaxID=2742824 RepID=A0A7Y6TWJ2_9BURK|nr:SDR family NAD(P)-dependent oxidoreductase [Schlegelella koreensis]
MDLGLEGRSALITGASKGIGAAVAAALAAEGVATLHLAARDGAALERVAAELHARHGCRAVAHPTDLRDPSQLERLATDAGDVDLLINNAGDIPSGTLEQVDAAAWRHGWSLKVFGTIDLTRQVYARMKARRSGVIVNVIGAAGERLPAAYIAGSTGNAALMAFTRSLGGQSLNDGVRVLGINPGPVATDRIVALMRHRAQTQWGDAERYVELMQAFPLGRPAEPREIADVVAFMASARASYMSGCIVTVDGGAAASGASR